MRFSFVYVPLAAAVLLVAPALAQYPDPFDIRACTDIEIDAQRLACYDRATHRDDAAPPAAERGELPESFRHDAERRADGAAVARDLLDSRWELDPASKLGTFNIRGFRPVYVMPVFATTDRNTLPRLLPCRCCVAEQPA